MLLLVDAAQGGVGCRSLNAHGCETAGRSLVAIAAIVAGYLLSSIGLSGYFVLPRRVSAVTAAIAILGLGRRDGLSAG